MSGKKYEFLSTLKSHTDTFILHLVLEMIRTGCLSCRIDTEQKYPCCHAELVIHLMSSREKVLFLFYQFDLHVLFALMHISLWYEENHHNETSVIMLLVPASESTRHILFTRKKTQRMLYQNTKKLLFFYVSNWNIFPRQNILDLLKSFHTLIIQKHFSGVQIMAILVTYYCYFRKTLLAFRTLIY